MGLDFSTLAGSDWDPTYGTAGRGTGRVSHFALTVDVGALLPLSSVRLVFFPLLAPGDQISWVQSGALTAVVRDSDAVGASSLMP